jgi:hypothetical protein
MLRPPTGYPMDTTASARPRLGPFLWAAGESGIAGWRCSVGSSLAGRRALLGLHGFSERSALGFNGCRLAVARSNQFLLELQPFVGCHGGLFALRRQIFYREIAACFGGSGASAHASISDEPAVEVAQPPSERLNKSSAPAASALLAYAIPMHDRSTNLPPLVIRAFGAHCQQSGLLLPKRDSREFNRHINAGLFQKNL